VIAMLSVAGHRREVSRIRAMHQSDAASRSVRRRSGADLLIFCRADPRSATAANNRNPASERDDPAEPRQKCRVILDDHDGDHHVSAGWAHWAQRHRVPAGPEYRKRAMFDTEVMCLGNREG
jgi:hypothetical protein